jgi:hypothetical protein
MVVQRIKPDNPEPAPQASNPTVASTPIPQNPSHPLLQLDQPHDGQTISSPLIISGKARGTWFFEATFPVVLTNWDGLIIAQGVASAEGDWMTQDFVPFKAELSFVADTTVSNRGSLILQKANPSGLPENDDAYEITVLF